MSCPYDTDQIDAITSELEKIAQIIRTFDLIARSQEKSIEERIASTMFILYFCGVEMNENFFNSEKIKYL